MIISGSRLSPYPVWWSWFGAEYAEAVAEHLPPDQVETVGAGLFHWRSEMPADRDVLTAPLARPADRSRRRIFSRSAEPEPTWLPRELLATMAGETIGSYAVPQPAGWLPQTLV